MNQFSRIPSKFFCKIVLTSWRELFLTDFVEKKYLSKKFFGKIVFEIS